MNRTAVALMVIVAGGGAIAEAQTRPVTRPAPSRSTRRRSASSSGGLRRPDGHGGFRGPCAVHVNAETGNFTTAYDVKPGPLLGISVSARVSHRLAVGHRVTGFAADVAGAPHGVGPAPILLQPAAHAER